MVFKSENYIIYGDTREDKGGTRVQRLSDFVKRENSLNFTVLTKRLDYGDYEIIDKKTETPVCGVEWKTSKDFYGSLIPEQKVINQCLDLKNEYGTAFLVIQGTLFDFVLRNRYISNENKDMTIRQLYGARNKINIKYAKVIEAPNEQLGFWNLCNIIKKTCEGKNGNHHHVSIADNDYDYAFSCLDLIRDLGHERVQTIMDGLNIEHFEDLFKIEYNDLKGLDGFGHKLASSVFNKLHKYDKISLDI